MPWRHNALRHSFCSYQLADVKSAAQVALEAGNSPAMIFSNYPELVTPADAKVWFAVYPPKAGGGEKNRGNGEDRRNVARFVA